MLAIWPVARCLKLLQKHAVLKPPRKNTLQDDAVSVDTWKKYDQHALTLFGIASNSLGK